MKLDPEREERAKEALDALDRVMHEPGAFQWMEMAAERCEALPDRVWQAYHGRLYDLVQEFAAALGLEVKDLPRASMLVSLLLGRGRDDDDDDEPEPDPTTPHGDEIVA